MQRKYLFALLLPLIAMFSACNDDPQLIGDPVTGLSQKLIKRTVTPNRVGGKIEFLYALALPENLGHLTSAKVVATIPGAVGTYIDFNTYSTSGSGADVPTPIANPSVHDATGNNGTTLTFFENTATTRDTMAAGLRYFYVIPEAARGKEVTFTFSATASNGQSVTITEGPCYVGLLDMKLDLKLVSGNTTSTVTCFLSFADMAVYTKAQIDADPSLVSKIDLVYVYRSPVGATSFGHALYSPSAVAGDAVIGTAGKPADQVAMPTGIAANNTKIQRGQIKDRELSRLNSNLWADDPDFLTLDLSTAFDKVTNFKVEQGFWAESGDGKYRVYAYINTTPLNATSGLTISMKRMTMK